MNQLANPANQIQAQDSALNVHNLAVKINLNADATKVASRVFRCAVLSSRYVFKNGKVAPFIGGKYTTDIAHEIAELDAEIAQRHPHITANKEEVVTLSEPMEVLKQKFFAEFEAAQKAALNKNNDAGTSEQGKLNVANSTTVAAGMAGSDSTGTGPAAPTTGASAAKGLLVGAQK